MNNKRDGRKLQIEIVLYVKFLTWESDAHDLTKKKIQAFGISIWIVVVEPRIYLFF